MLVESIEFDTAAMAAALEGAYVTATDLADRLATTGVPFRSAHERTGAVVRAAEERGVELWQLTASELRRLVPEIEDVDGLLLALRPEASLAAHRSYGGPAPERVTEQIELAAERLREERRWLDELAPPPIYRAHLDGELLAEAIPGSGE